MTTTLNRLDLNLLRVFDAVMEERSVLRASQRICLSQSAVSHALARLREVLGDELFIRTPNGMQPTARALTMAPLVRQAWQSLETAVGAPKFEPDKATRRFTIAVSDFVTIVMVPRLLSLLRTRGTTDRPRHSAGQHDRSGRTDRSRTHRCGDRHIFAQSNQIPVTGAVCVRRCVDRQVFAASWKIIACGAFETADRCGFFARRAQRLC